MGFPKRTDKNQTEIVSGLRNLGFTVWITSACGAGSPDVVIGAHGHNLMIEIKDGSKSPSQRKLTPLEDAFHKSWRGQIDVVNSLDEAIALIGKYVYREVT